MKIISILNSKGGVGKSTLSCHLARAFQLAAARVCIMDTDADQLSTQSWGGIQAEGIDLPVFGASRGIESQLRSIKGAFDVAVIDGAAKLERQDIQAIRVSDLVLIPVQPTLFDVWPIERLVANIRNQRDLSGGRPAAAFVAANHNPRVKESAELSAIFEEYPEFPFLSAQVPDRVIYSRSLDMGATVFDHEGLFNFSETRAAQQAAAEVTALRDEIIRRFKIWR